jgi:predicted transglutaminase-like cysteine proteinase
MNSGIRNGLRAVIAAAAMMVAAASAGAQTQLASLPTPSLGTTAIGGAKPLPAWSGFCQRQPAECAVDLDEPAIVPLTPRAWQLIVGVNQRVNTTIKPLTDMEHWGVPDRWDLPTDGRGDCEDFQLLKRKLLAEAGLPRRAMRMAVVVDDEGQGHAVLMIRTDRGDLVLDNKVSTVLPWHRTGYIFVKRESEESIGWVSLGGQSSPVVTANR